MSIYERCVDSPPEGFEYVWVEEGDDWRLSTYGEDRRCRYMHNGVPCRRPAVVALLRGHKRRSWWHYCDRHLYGRRVVDGKIECRRLVPLSVRPTGEGEG